MPQVHCSLSTSGSTPPPLIQLISSLNHLCDFSWQYCHCRVHYPLSITHGFMRLPQANVIRSRNTAESGPLFNAEPLHVHFKLQCVLKTLYDIDYLNYIHAFFSNPAITMDYYEDATFRQIYRETVTLGELESKCTEISLGIKVFYKRCPIISMVWSTTEPHAI